MREVKADSPVLFDIVLEVLAKTVRQEGEIKSIQIRMTEVKLYICRWQDIVHREPQRFHQETTRTDKWVHQSSRIEN